MALRRGTAALQEAKAAFDNRGGDTRRFWLRDGETRVVRVWGDFTNQESPQSSPTIAKRHYIKRLPKGEQWRWCGRNNDQPCVDCYYRDRGDKGISGSNDVALIFLSDMSRFHKLDQEVRVLKPGIRVMPGRAPSPDAYVNTKYPPCSAPKRACEYCNMGNEVSTGGFKTFDLSTSYADQLSAQEMLCRDYCRCGAQEAGGGGTIQVHGYSCSNCGAAVDFYPEHGSPVAYCQACRQTLAPNESISCTVCGDGAQRGAIQDFLWNVSRTGSNQGTTYNFSPIFPANPPTEEEVAEMLKAWPDWEKLTAAPPPEQQAASLGLALPQGMGTAGHGTKTYGGPPVNPPAHAYAAQGERPPANAPPRPVAPPPRPAAPAPRPATPPVRPAAPPAAAKPVLKPMLKPALKPAFRAPPPTPFDDPAEEVPEDNGDDIHY